MDKFKILIDKNIKIRDLSSYLNVVAIANENIYSNPDICIESCKSLIEGISKTLILELDKSKRLDDIKNLTLEKLYKTAVETVDKYNDQFETDFAKRFSTIVQIIGEIRNERGDISHGRPVPKVIESDSYLSKLIYDLTDSFLEYLLKHFFDIDFREEGLIYSKLEEYNNYLDEQVVLNIPINTFKISEIIYERDFDAYRNIYYDEFLAINNDNKESQDEEIINTTISNTENIIPSNELQENVSNPKKIIFEDSLELKISSFLSNNNINEILFRDIIDDFLKFEILPEVHMVGKLPADHIRLSERKLVINELHGKIKSFLNDI